MATQTLGVCDAYMAMQPPGDTATRKGLWDAVARGCIPVVFGELGWAGTDIWWPPHRGWTQRVPLGALHSPGGVLGFLRALPRASVAAKHAALLSVRPRLLYQPGSGTAEDAGRVIVERLQTHFLDFHERVRVASADAEGRMRRLGAAPAIDRLICCPSMHGPRTKNRTYGFKL